MKSVIVIGAGVGGIATAARLAQSGYQVTVLEKNEQAGGRCGFMEMNGHKFDTGATLFLIPELYTQAFSDLGERIEDHLELIRVDPTYHIHFDDNSELNLTSDLFTMQNQLEAIEPGSFLSFLRYLDDGCRSYKQSLPNLVQRDFRNWFEFLSPKSVLMYLRLNALKDHYRHLGIYFEDPRLKIAFTFQNMYMGLSPFDAPAIFSLMQYTEFADGVWFPKGGMYKIVTALVNIAKRSGVQFLFNSPISHINIEKNCAASVTLEDGTRFPADIIVANADLPYVYRHLLPQDGTANWLERKDYGTSAIVFYWGLDRAYPQLAAHNLFFASIGREGFDPIFQAQSLPEKPNFYVHVPTRLDPSLAPEGHDSFMAAIPCGHLDDGSSQDWKSIQMQSRKYIIERLREIGVDQLEKHIKFETSFNPYDWQGRYNLVKGATHGLSHKLTQMGYLRPSNRHARYRNLFFVGASTHPGTGLPTVLVSARLVSERIMREIGIPSEKRKTKPKFSYELPSQHE